MKTVPYALTIVVFIGLAIFGLKSGLQAFGETFKKPQVYVVSDTLNSPDEDQWEILDGQDAEGNWMRYGDVIALVENKGSYDPVPVPKNWTRP